MRWGALASALGSGYAAYSFARDPRRIARLLSSTDVTTEEDRARARKRLDLLLRELEVYKSNGLVWTMAQGAVERDRLVNRLTDVFNCFAQKDGPFKGSILQASIAVSGGKMSPN